MHHDLQISHHTTLRIKACTRLSVTHTQYNLAIHYRENLGKPIPPWDKDALVRLYMSLPWAWN